MTVFSKIAAGEIPSYRIAEDDRHYAFLDIFPVNEGHTLVIPKKETDYIFDLSPQELAEMTLFAQRVAKAIDKAIPCKRVAVLVLGLEIPHAHIHLVPINGEADIFRREKLKFTEHEFENTAAKIRDAMTD
jgi:histidine triad (HIT) family protein